ncbi:cobalt-precorrin-5B (C(1))-methyltransferase CbiD [Candidatus Magnetomonas plexicatena]|uniref:cobalt-precorrin-5B (C(1))-methyltransferase CbiD n=1 Tax=Candidatus Magnetomonas plexicatena TaxID=2552947 RepID=UPI0011049E7B|nr:cobalamin biosynthesis protein CbiD [Nitrospirales bacterium LBB_01]
MLTLNKRGFTTGAGAAAAAKAAAIFLKTGTLPKSVHILLPNVKESLLINIHSGTLTLNINTATASVIKLSGDDPDVTNGLEIVAALRLLKHSIHGIAVTGGAGVGRVTKEGLQQKVGDWAINPVPRAMITQSVSEVFSDDSVRLEIEISVVNGELAALKTFNPRLGITGGISILGTTGIVEPMSVDAIKETVKCEIDVSFCENPDSICLAPGKIGEDALRRILQPSRVVQFSNFPGFAMDYVKQKGFRHTIIGGHPGKLAKILMGYADTHSGRSPQATAFVAEFMGLNDNYNTVEEIIGKVANIGGDFTKLAHEICVKIQNIYRIPSIDVYLFDMKKTLIGHSTCTG